MTVSRFQAEAVAAGCLPLRQLYLLCCQFAFLINSVRGLNGSASNPEGFWKNKCLCVGRWDQGNSPSFQQSVQQVIVGRYGFAQAQECVELLHWSGGSCGPGSRGNFWSPPLIVLLISLDSE